MPEGGTGQTHSPFPPKAGPGSAQGTPELLLWLQEGSSMSTMTERPSFSTCQNNSQAGGFVWVYLRLIVPAEDLLNPAMTAVLSPPVTSFYLVVKSLKQHLTQQ